MNFIVDMTHVNAIEIEKVKNLIEILQMRQSLLSETTIVSEDALCPICYAQQNSEIHYLKLNSLRLNFILDSIFEPCHHQSCHSCIIQHLMSVKLCFYCKAFVTEVKKLDGTIIYENDAPSITPSETHITRDTQTESDSE